MQIKLCLNLKLKSCSSENAKQLLCSSHEITIEHLQHYVFALQSQNVCGTQGRAGEKYVSFLNAS